MAFKRSGVRLPLAPPKFPQLYQLVIVSDSRWVSLVRKVIKTYKEWRGDYLAEINLDQAVPQTLDDPGVDQAPSKNKLFCGRKPWIGRLATLPSAPTRATSIAIAVSSRRL